MTPTTLHACSATQLGALFARGDTTPREALDAVLARLGTVQPLVNPVVAMDLVEARAAADRSTERWRGGKPLSPLDGVPMVVKDNIPVRGMPCTWGSALYRDLVPAQDELPAARLRAAGAVLMGKANVPEFTLQGFTGNKLFGVTGNPWQPALTPGGSSGGVVAAVASGIGPIGLATDGGGSIRRPCGYTGLVGLKPGIGRVPRRDGLPPILLDFEVVGPVGRSVADVALAMQVLGPRDAFDARSHRYGAAGFALERPPRLRIGYLRQVRDVDGSDAPLDPAIAQATDRVAARLAALGHHVDDDVPPTLPNRVNQQVWPALSASGLGWLMQRLEGAHPSWRTMIDPSLLALAETGIAQGAGALFEALQQAALFRDELQQQFARHDLLLTPTAAAMPWEAAQRHPRRIDGHAVGPRGHAVYTAFVNAAGVPAIALPALSAADAAPGDLPIGFQLVGAMGTDELLCRVGAEYEAAHPWQSRWPVL